MRRGVRSLVVAALFASVCAAGAASAQTYYKWVDARGVTHYSEQPPAAVKAKTIELSAPLPAAPAVAGTALAPTSPSTSLDQAKRDFRVTACATARNNLKLLSSHAMVLDAGTVTHPAQVTGGTKLSPEQRDAATADALKQIQDFCERG